MDVHYIFRSYTQPALIDLGRVAALAVIAREEHLMTVYEVGQTCFELGIPITNNALDVVYSKAEMKQFDRGYKDS